MAFENINWGMPVAAQQRDADRFQQMIGNISDSIQSNKELKLKQLELENKPVDVMKMAENALAKRYQGVKLSPQEESWIKTAQTLAKDQIYTDAAGQMVVKPSGWKNIGGAPSGVQNTIPARPPVSNFSMGEEFPKEFDTAPQENIGAPLTVSDLGGVDNVNIPPVDLNNFVDPMQGSNAPQDVVSTDDGTEPLDPIKATGPLANSLVIKVKEAEMNMDMKKEAELAKLRAAIAFKQTQMKSEAGRKRVTGTIVETMNKLEGINDKLKAKQAVINNDGGALQNLKTKYGTSWLGRQTGSVTKPEIETLRKNYEVIRDSLIPSYIAYNELPATVVDTEEFQKRILNSFGDPSLTYETNEAALNNMKMQFGLSDGKGTEKQGKWSIKRK